MLRRRIIRPLLIFFVFASPLAPSLPAQIEDRMALPVDRNQLAVVEGNVHPLARTASDRGAVDPSLRLHRMTLNLKLSATRQSDLDHLLREQQDPSSPLYHRWLTPEEFADRFGATPNNIKQITDWLQHEGFEIVEIARSRTYVAFSGSAAQVTNTFRTPIHRYIVSGREHFANTSAPLVPVALSAIVTGITGLNDFRPRPVVKARPARPEFTSSISGNHYLAPDDLATIYNVKPLYGAGIDGTGAKIAIAGQTDILTSDIDTFRSVSGLPADTPQVILIPGSPDPGISDGDITEADLDLEWSGALAPHASIIYVNSGTENGVFDSLQYAIDQNLAPVVSISYSECEPQLDGATLSSLSAAAKEASALGITVVASSGDSGPAGCDAQGISSDASSGLAVDFPASSPYVTAVGGTEFNEGSGDYWSSTNNAKNGSALSYIPEIVWNDSAADSVLYASGGGPSSLFSKPTWQTGTGVPNDGARDLPDVALTASGDHDGYLICSQGSCVDGYRMSDTYLNVEGGTSASAPSFAGIVALINQKTQTTQGSINPRLYQLAALSQDAFHDIVSGSNIVPCKLFSPDCPASGSFGYTAGLGYDLATGLGSVNAYNLVNEWAPIVSLAPNPIGFGPRFNGTVTAIAVSYRNNTVGPITVISIAVSGAFSQQNNCPPSLAVTASCTITVFFAPQNAGQQSGNLQITDSSANSPYSIPVTGNALAADTITPTRPARPSAPASTPAASSLRRPTAMGRVGLLRLPDTNFVIGRGR